MRERGDEDGRGIIAVAERSGIEPWRDQFYNEHSDTLDSRLLRRFRTPKLDILDARYEFMNKSEVP
jgi:hypothetical protein